MNEVIIVEGSKAMKKIKSKEYPAVTLGKAIEFVKKFKDYQIKRPISYAIAAEAIRVKPTTKSFTYTLSAAKQFGLITTSSGKTLTLTDVANRLVRPVEDASVLNRLRVDCFALPNLYTDLINEYSGRSMPAIEVLENVLVSNYDIAPNAANTAATTFIETANEVGTIHNGILDMNSDPSIFKETQNTMTEVINQGTTATELKIDKLQETEFEAPLSIPFGEKKKALLYMPLDVKTEDAEYALEMIKLMFKRMYGVTMK